MTDGTAGRDAPRRALEVIAALLAELRPWAWRAQDAARDPGFDGPGGAAAPWEPAQFATVARTVRAAPRYPRRTQGPR